MHKRSGLSLFGGLAILVAACSGGATPTPSTASTAPSTPASAPASSEASTPASNPASAPATSDLKIGVVTDIGTLNDKNYNEYSFKGAEAGAAAIGAKEPTSFVPTSASDYASGIKSFTDQKFDVIITVGFNLASATVQAAHDNPDVWFIGVDQSPICVTADGLPDSSFACAGDAKTLLPKYISINFQEDQAGYLAGIVAAGASQKGTIGAIGGTSICAPCVRYIQGYELGAKSVKPDIKVVTAYVTNDFSAKAFQDQAGGKTFADNFLKQNKDVDVLFQVAGLTGNGIIDSACAANILGIGVDVDQFVSYPAGDPCLLTSAEKHLQLAVSDALKAVAGGSATPGDVLYDAKNDGIGVSQGHNLGNKWAPDTQAKINAALAGMKDGSLKTCPDKCGSLQ
ncbi:MAG TPA: BMP family ABC transporter substrate-binding protein [Candidatus Limnocylindrales bacterium]|nr:BMP family ABC transporter substrate-binding protein [Candidatus Limnocylindrales bacterium]